MVNRGLLIKGDSSYCSPVFFVSKKPGPNKTAAEARLCFDYRKLNSHIKSLNFPLKTIKQFYDEAKNYKLFSVLDVRNAFNSVQLTPRAQKLCGIITPFGVYLPVRSPFGLKTSPSSFLAVLDKVLGDLKFTCSYDPDRSK